MYHLFIFTKYSAARVSNVPLSHRRVQTPDDEWIECHSLTRPSLMQLNISSVTGTSVRSDSSRKKSLSRTTCGSNPSCTSWPLTCLKVPVMSSWFWGGNGHSISQDWVIKSKFWEINLQLQEKICSYAVVFYSVAETKFHRNVSYLQPNKKYWNRMIFNICLILNLFKI